MPRDPSFVPPAGALTPPRIGALGVAAAATAGQGVALEANGMLPPGVHAPSPTADYVLAWNGTTGKPEWRLLTSASITDGTITSADIADGTIVDADVNAAAAIAYSKLNLASSIVSGDIVDGTITSGDIADGTIVNADINASAAIAQSKLAFDAWQTFTPTLTATTTNPTLGSGSVATGAYVQIGKTILGRLVLVFGSGAAAGSGTYRISVPVTANSSGPQAGGGFVFDNSAVLARLNSVDLATTTNFECRIDNAGLGLVTDAVPWVWAQNDQISFFFMYQAA